MDLAVYISELLGLHGEVNVPEIGYFAQIRTNGYYSKDENKFYPPGHDISFQPQFTEDDALARYISGKKNISLASSRYFIDKYVSEVKQHAATQRVEIAGLGYLQSENSTLSFQANNTARENDPAFYGFQPVNAYSLGDQPVEKNTPPAEEVKAVEHVPAVDEMSVKDVPGEVITDKTVITPTVIAPEEQIHEEPEYVDEEVAPRRFLNIWVILLLIVTIVGLALLGIYQYNPSVFDKLMNSKQSPVVKPAATTPTTQPAVTPDTVGKGAVKQDTVAKAKPPIVPDAKLADTSNAPRFEVIGGSFKTKNQAEISITNYKSLGVEAKIITDAPGPRFKLTLGTYKTYEEAWKARTALIKQKRVSKDIYPLKINPRK